MSSDKDPRANFDGVPNGWLVEVDEATGCSIGSAGVRPDEGYAFLYHDNRHHFFFYASRVWPTDTSYDVTVDRASVQRFAGPPPRVPQGDVASIEKNLGKFFLERDFSSSSRVRPPAETFREISFTWKFRTPAAGT